MGDVGYRSMHQGISHRFFFSIALDFAENEPIWYLSSGYYLGGRSPEGKCSAVGYQRAQNPPSLLVPAIPQAVGPPEGEPTAPTPKKSQHHSALANSPTPSFTRRVSARIFVCAKDTNYRREEVRRGGQRDLFPAGTAQRGRARDRGSSVQLAIRELRTPTPFSYP